MLSKDELLRHPNYLLTKYQNEIYRQIIGYIEEKKITQKELAQKLGVSNAYMSQIINGNFNFTLKKLIELALAIGKVPVLEFSDINSYWQLNGVNAKTYRGAFKINQNHFDNHPEGIVLRMAEPYKGELSINDVKATA